MGGGRQVAFRIRQEVHMNSNRSIDPHRQHTPTGAGLFRPAPESRWIVGVLEQMQQANSAVERHYGRSRAMWRGNGR